MIPTLKQANAEFNKKNYQTALDLYLKISNHHPNLSKHFSANIRICKNRVAELNADNPHATSVPSNLIAPLLAGEPVLCQKTQPDFTHYLKAVADLKQGRISTETLSHLLQCAKISPFQRTLLTTLHDIMQQLGVIEMLQQYRSSAGLKIGQLINLASNFDYWAAFRYATKKIMLERGINSPHAEDLLALSPERKECKPLSLQLNQAPLQKCASTSFATILLNEQKFIGENLVQHYSLCDEWVLIEGACKGYPERKVSTSGLSKDATSLIINIFPDPFCKIQYIRYGWTRRAGEDAKSELRNQYLKRITGVRLVVIDADEFYIPEDLAEGLSKLEDSKYSAVTLPQVHFWKSTRQFITGEYYDVSHTRMFRVAEGMRHIRNHNFPELNGKFLHEGGQFKFPRAIERVDANADAYQFVGPKCYHMGFAKDMDDMRDKTDYYVNRGESETRIATTRSRAAWFDGSLPEKCKLRKWGGQLPVVLKNVGGIE